MRTWLNRGLAGTGPVGSLLWYLYLPAPANSRRHDVCLCCLHGYPTKHAGSNMATWHSRVPRLLLILSMCLRIRPRFVHICLHTWLQPRVRRAPGPFGYACCGPCHTQPGSPAACAAARAACSAWPRPRVDPSTPPPVRPPAACQTSDRPCACSLAACCQPARRQQSNEQDWLVIAPV